MTLDHHSPAPTDFTVTHRWPWRTGEFGTMAFFAATCLFFGWLNGTWLGITLGVVSALAVLWLLYHTKVSRVTRSQVTATVTGTRLAIVSDGAVGQSAVDLAKVTHIGYRRFGSDECFMLSDGTQGARLPVRLLGNDNLRERFDATWAATANYGHGAEDLRQRWLAGETLG